MMRCTFRVGLTVTCLAAFAAAANAENRSYDGTNNNLSNPAWGAANTQLIRKSFAAYSDGYASPAGPNRPSAREISNVAIAQTVMAPNAHHMTDWVFQWGQFVDHDIDLTMTFNPPTTEEFDIPIPAGDPVFDPNNTGTALMPFTRSLFDVTTGTDPGNPRQQINSITSYLDGSQVYGSSANRALALCTGVGGRLKTSAGNLLPLNTPDLNLPNGDNGAPDRSQFYVAGDVRVNEQVGLTAIHTLMMREHNRLAAQIESTVGGTDEAIYQRVRKLVGAEIQVITYNEFLPALLGASAPGFTGAYQDDVDASIATEFSTALFRVGHTMLPPRLMRMQNDGTEAPGGPMALRDAFFKPHNISDPGELDYMLKGLASEEQQEVDMHLIDDVRDFLFGEPLAGGFDLGALNIQRGRDHGLPDYNSIRQAYGLNPIDSFDEITSDPSTQAALSDLYCDSPGSCDFNDIDVWVGAVAEDHLPGQQVGPLISAGLVEQFTRTRDGDRFWYRNDPDLSPDDIAWLESVRLSDVIRWNTSISNIQNNVFFMPVPEPALAVLLLWALAMGGLVTKRRGRA